MSLCNVTKSFACNRTTLQYACMLGLNVRRSVSRWGPTESELLKAKSFERMPRVPMFPFIGSAWAYLPYIGKYSIEEMHKADLHKNETYGDAVRERFGKLDVVNAYHQDALRMFMTYDEEYPSRGSFASLNAYRLKRKMWYNPPGLLVTDGKSWKELRQLLEDYLSKPEVYENFMKPLNGVGEDFASLIRQKRDQYDEVDVLPLLSRWSLEALSSVALHERLGCLDPDLSLKSDAMHLLNSMEIQVLCMNKMEASAGNLQFWKYLPTPTWRRFVKSADTFREKLFKMVNRAAYEPLKPGDHPSLMQYIGRTNTSTSLVIMADLMLSGVDTTSSAAAFLLYDLARNPEKQNEALKEIFKILPNDEVQFTLDKLSKMNYLNNCLKESMRLHPITRGNIRVFPHDVIVNGYRVPAGTAILCALQTMYRQERYFQMPDTFLPERWEGSLKGFFVPFGYGSRSCIGSKLAEMEILTMTVQVLRKFSLEYHHGEVGIRTRLVNVPAGPVKLRLKERTQAKPLKTN